MVGVPHFTPYVETFEVVVIDPCTTTTILPQTVPLDKQFTTVLRQDSSFTLDPYGTQATVDFGSAFELCGPYTVVLADSNAGGPVCTLTVLTISCTPTLETQVITDQTLTLTTTFDNYPSIPPRVETFLLDVEPCVTSFDQIVMIPASSEHTIFGTAVDLQAEYTVDPPDFGTSCLYTQVHSANLVGGAALPSFIVPDLTPTTPSFRVETSDPVHHGVY